MSPYFTLSSLGLLLLCSNLAFAHPGRTDSSGGHHDRKNGGYHYHGGSIPTPPVASSPPPRPIYRSSARTVARSEPRTSARSKTVSVNSLFSGDPIPPPSEHPLSIPAATNPLPKDEPSPLAEPNYVLVLQDHRKLEIVSYKEQSDAYSIVATHGGKAVYPKKIVDHIEPIIRIRTWTDNSGQFRVEASFVEQRGTIIELKRANGETIHVDLDRLSKADKDYVEAFPAKSDEGDSNSSK